MPTSRKNENQILPRTACAPKQTGGPSGTARLPHVKAEHSSPIVSAKKETEYRTNSVAGEGERDTVASSKSRRLASQ